MIEFETVQMIRKRAKTEFVFCLGCGADSDFVSHVEAAELFETSSGQLYQFIKENDCHHDVSWNGTTYLCIASLLAVMHERTNGDGVKLLGG